MENPGNVWIRRAVESDEVATEGPLASVPAEAAPCTFIGEQADFEGTLRLRDDLRIDSEFRGSIESQGTVTVGQTAGLECDIRARVVVVCGAVVGNIVASRELILRAGARLTGDIEAPCLEIEKHAVHNGRTTMRRPEASRSAADERSDTASTPEAASPTLPAT